MEDVLDLYAQPHDPSRPVVCVDEGGKQLIGDVREPLPVRAGSPAKQDCNYQRGGMANLFMAFEPLAGRRQVVVTERKRSVDFAGFLRQIADEWYAEVSRVVLVCDNLNTHTPAALYEAFEPAEARRLAERFEWHYTPKHGSWLNMAEIELSVLTGQCLNRRIGSKEELEREVVAWQRQRNEAQARIDWRFTTDTARIKLKKLYPTIVT